MASSLELFCGKSLNNHTFWQHNVYGYCYEQLIFVLSSHVLLALVSVVCICLDHTNNTSALPTNHTLKRSTIQNIRLVIAISSALIPALSLLLNQFLGTTNPAPFNYLVDSISSIAWMLLSLYLWKFRCHSERATRTHRPVIFALTLTLLLVSQGIRLSTIIKQLLNDDNTLFVGDEVTVITATTLQILYFLSLLPSPRRITKKYMERGNVSSYRSINEDRGSDHQSLLTSPEELQHRSSLWIAEDNANLLSKFTLWWMQPLVRKGAKGELQNPCDLFHLPKKMATIHVDTYFSRIHLNGSSAFKREFPFESNHEDRISDNGSTQIQKSFTKNPNNNNCPEIIVHGQRKRLTLFRALFKAFGLRYLAWSAVQLICTALLVVNPLLLHSLLTFMDDPSEPIINGYLYAAGMVSVSALSYLFSHQCQYQFEKIKTEARAALITTVYRKALAVSVTRLSTFTPGQVINFMSVDSKRASRGLMSVYNLWTVPFQVSIALFAVYKQIGVAVIGGLTVLVILMPLTKYLMGKIIMFHKSMLKQKDCRVKFMNEMLSGIRVIKFYSWERQFKKQIKDLRSEELRSLKAVKYLAAFNVYIWSTLSIFIPLCTLSTYVLMGNQLTAPMVFTSLALLSTIEKPLNAFPNAVNHVLEGWVSIGRLQQFMDLPESELSSFYISSDKLSEGEMLTIRQGTFIWDNFQKNRNKNYNNNVIQDDTDVREEEESGDTNHTLDYKRKYQESVKLEGIDLNVMKGQLVGVIGRTGSGKSSLLAAILGDMEKEKGSIGVAGLDQGFGVSTQEPWLQYATVKENILFGREYEASRYKRVIEACALVEDFKIWPAGDNTEVGDNGIILSGGQRARVALARAVYQESEIYLLDDPLAALDAHVGQQIFSKCIMGLLENKTRILCTHHIRFLVDADIMVVMDGFKIVNQGPPSVVFNLPQYAKQPNYSEIESRAETGTSESGKEFLGGNLAEEEEKEQGAVKFGIYRSYWKAIGSYLAFFIIVMFLLTQASTHIIDWWLSYWTSHTKDQTNQTVPLQPVTPSSDPETHGYSISTSGTNSSSSLAFYLGIYLGLVVTNSVFAITEAVMFAYGCVHAAQIIHDRLLNSIIKAPIYFFDKTPVGRILNRFSSDTYVVDYTLSLSIFGFIGGLLTFLAKAALTCYGIPLMLLCLIPLCAFYYFIQNYYRKTSRELRRIYNVTNSAIYRHFSETLAGLTVIKGMRATNRFRQEIISRVDLNQRAFFMERALEIWLSIRLSLIGLAILTGVAVFAVIKHHYNAVDTSLVGLALLYSLSITQSMKSIIRGIGDTEQDMVSLERLRYYTADIPQEPRDSFIKPPSHWPKNGVIKFKNVHFSYREDLPKSMDGVSFESLPGEKIGIVGRSGSGKSTLFLALFRMVQIQQGCVTIDGIDLGHLSPEDVRSRLAIIPQDPFLLSGSVRMNLDPVGQFSDSELWCVLEKCHIKDVVTRMGGIEASAGEGGKQFSTGQKQLMCLARAMLTKKKVLCIDEATSGVDLETDAIMQGVIKEEFQDNTILTIAHRLDVVEDCDRILVMDTGKVVKFE